MDGRRRDAASLALLGSQALALASGPLSGSLGPTTALTCVLMFALGLVTASRMTVVGVTGGIACGKSTFCRHLAKVHGAAVIDFDKLSREVRRGASRLGCHTGVGQGWVSRSYRR